MLLTIEKSIYGGEGLGRMPAEPGDERVRGKAVFVPFVLDGERIEVGITEEKTGFARGMVEKIVERSALRVEAGCPHFGECGGCHYQHTDYGNQLVIKQQILRDTFERIAKVPLPSELQVHGSPPWNYRNRTRMRLRGAPEFLMGYNRSHSSDVLPVRVCPISSPLINRAIDAVWTLGEAGLTPDCIREIEFFADASDEALLLDVTVAGNKPGVRTFQLLAGFAQALRERVPQIRGCAIFSEEDEKSKSKDMPVRLEPPENLRESFGEGGIAYHCNGADYRVSSGSFFQTNRFLAGKLVEIVTTGVSGEYAMDLYAGTGLFSVPLARAFSKVAAVEASSYGYEDLRQNAPPNVRSYNAATGKFLSSHAKGARPDCVVVDPPRAGLGEKLAGTLAGLSAPRIIYVSCDPATLARDARVILSAGYGIEEAHLIDIFPQTFHIETVLRLAR